MAENELRSQPLHQRAASVRVLEGPCVVIGGRRVTVPEGSERLLVFVALRGRRAVSRRQLAGTLWPDVPEARAAGNLRTALWRLRSAGIHILADDRHSLSLVDGAVVDMHLVAAWAGRIIDGTADADDLSMRSFHPGALDLLPGWDEDWLVFERERLRQRALHALEELSRRLAHLGRAAESVDAAMTAIDADPLRESAQRALIRIHLAEGNVTEAERAYRAFARLLDAELGVVPTAETSNLARAWSSGREAAGVSLRASRPLLRPVPVAARL